MRQLYVMIYYCFCLVLLLIAPKLLSRGKCSIAGTLSRVPLILSGINLRCSTILVPDYYYVTVNYYVTYYINVNRKYLPACYSRAKTKTQGLCPKIEKEYSFAL